MAKITKIDKATAVMLGDELMAAAKQIAAKYGLTAKRGSGRFGDSEYKLNSMTFFVNDGEVAPVGRYAPAQIQKMAVDFNFMKNMNGLGDVNVGDTYFDSQKGCDMKVIGWDTKKRKYPILVECLADNSVFKMTAMSLKINMSK